MNAFKCDKGRQLQIEECIFESMVEPKDKRAELNTKTTFRAEENGVEVIMMMDLCQYLGHNFFRFYAYFFSNSIGLKYPNLL